MITDFQILGIEETKDISVIKQAFRQKVKQLHPDTSKDDSILKNHLLFIEVCNAYDRLIASYKSSNVEFVPNVSKVNSLSHSNKDIVQHADPSYVYYRNATKLFSKIHPSQWNIDTSRMLNTKIVDDDKEQEIIKQKVKDLVSLFPRAYYYFSIVVHDYPSSIWYQDSKDKMQLIEERISRYKHIIESFTVWNNMEKDKKEKYRKMLHENRKSYNNFKDEYRKEWEKK